MVTVILEEAGGSIRAFEVSGHAGFKPKGEDIVCAAVSALAQTAALGLGHYLPEKVKVAKEEGFLRVELSPDLDDEELTRAQIILETFALGLTSIKAGYASYMDVKRRGCKVC
jgi:uncharacterized protein YsxB (DUF464 family)